MILRRNRNFIGLCLVFLALGFFAETPQFAFAQTTVISFEQSEGFPAPELLSNMAPGGTRNPYYSYTGFAGGPNTGYAAHPDGPVLEKPLFSTNGGVVANWTVASVYENPVWTNPRTVTTEARNLGTWFVDDGPGGLDINLGSVPSSAPAPVSGSAVAGFGGGMEGGVGYAYVGVMDLDNSQNLQLDSFYYANRGNGPPRLQVEYYANDPDETYLGMNTYAMGTDPDRDIPNAGDQWVGVAANYEPKFQKITPSPVFQGVALGKVLFRSFADGYYDPDAAFQDYSTQTGNGDIPRHDGHGTFFLDDISVTSGGGAFNPNNYTRLSFEAEACQDCVGGFPDADGTGIQYTGIPGVVTSFQMSESSIANLQIDHGPGGTGSGLPEYNRSPDTEPNPVHGSQALHTGAIGNGIFEVTIDLENGPAYGYAGMSYANRGNFPPRLIVEYYDTNETFIGEDVHTAPEGDGVGVGLSSGYLPKYQFVEPSERFQNVALSKIKITSSPPNPAGGSGIFSLDDILLVPGSGSFDFESNPCSNSSGSGGGVCVSFDPHEGYPEAAGAAFQDTGVGVVDNWGHSGFGAEDLQTDSGHDGHGFTDWQSGPVSGRHFALSDNIGNGEHLVTMDLDNSENLALQSFYFASRGNFPPKLTVEYYGLDEELLGTDVFTENPDGPGIGLNLAYGPEFQLLTASAQFQNAPLSKLVFLAEHDSPNNWGAAFGLDDILFSVVSDQVLEGDFNQDGKVDAVDYTTWRDGLGVTYTQADYLTWKANFGNSTSGTAAAVPEPACLALLLPVGLIAVNCLSRRRRLG